MIIYMLSTNNKWGDETQRYAEVHLANDDQITQKRYNEVNIKGGHDIQW